MKCKICPQTSVKFVMVSISGVFGFTGLGHVNMRKAKAGGHSGSPLTAEMHPSFCTQGHYQPGTTPNRMLSAVLGCFILNSHIIKDLKKCSCMFNLYKLNTSSSALFNTFTF